MEEISRPGKIGYGRFAFVKSRPIWPKTTNSQWAKPDEGNTWLETKLERRNPADQVW